MSALALLLFTAPLAFAQGATVTARSSYAVPVDGARAEPLVALGLGTTLEDAHRLGLRAHADPTRPHRRYGAALDYRGLIDAGHNPSPFVSLSLGFVAEPAQANRVDLLAELGVGLELQLLRGARGAFALAPELGIVPATLRDGQLYTLHAPYASLNLSWLGGAR